MPTRSFSRAMPMPVESWVPKRQNSLPTQVLTVRRLLPEAWPEGMSSSFQTAGKSSFFMPSKSMRWPPVTLTIGTLYLSATSAMRRSSDGLVTRSEEHTSELQSLMRISYAVFCLKKQKNTEYNNHNSKHTPKEATVVITLI